jgi:hypothetical protein
VLSVSVVAAVHRIAEQNPLQFLRTISALRAGG